jgi:uncharacterized protein with NRDE domain
MCLILIAWQAHPDYPLVVAANRDEFFARPAAAAAFWPEAPQVLAGRDLEAGGSWLGISRAQRFAALTNYREGGRVASNARSRGALVADFLSGDTRPSAYLAQVAARAVDYNGFNLFVADGQCLAYYANRGDSPPRLLSPGIYGLSNHLLDTPWPKLATAKASFAEALAELPKHGSVPSICSPTRKSLPIPTCRRPAYRSPGSASSRQFSCAPKTTGRAPRRCSSVTGTV